MRRIDLICKLLGPLFIALVDGISTEVAIIVNFAMNLMSMVVEYHAIARVRSLPRTSQLSHCTDDISQVYKELPRLQANKTQPRTEISPSNRPRYPYGFSHNWSHAKDIAAQSFHDYNNYFYHRAFLPSFSGALLYFTVLNFAGQMVTYLLSSGYESTSIGIARTFAVALEIAATWAAPSLVKRIGPIRAGLWGLTWQMACLDAGAAIFFVYAQDHPMISASGLVIGAVLSRLGLRSFDLSAQLIVQEEVGSETRGAFSSVESAWQNGFELCSYVSTIVFSRPSQFKWPALISFVAVYLAGALFATFVRTRRGHLLHLERISDCANGKTRKRKHNRGNAPIGSAEDNALSQ